MQKQEEKHSKKREELVQRPTGEPRLETRMEGVWLERSVRLSVVADDTEREAGARSWRGSKQGHTG